jgi:hypothetical protein
MWRGVLGALACAGLVLLGGAVGAKDISAEDLASRHQALLASLSTSPMGVPLLVTSLEEGDLMHGEVHALLAQPFDRLASRLSQPREWCAVVLLHLNVKGCTHERAAGRDWVTFYSGRKGYESAADAYPLRLAFALAAADTAHLDIDLSAASGPMGTSDYRISLSAIPAAQGSFVRFSYAYRTSALSRMAARTYLATLGRDKVGFTAVGKGSDGKPQYVAGQRGIVERNAVRYYLAIQAYLESQAAAPEQRFEQSLQRWFELTERWPRQLHELDRDEYLSYKRRERAEQVQQQQAVDGAGRRP